MDGMPLRGESLTWGDNQQQRLEGNGAAQGQPARHQVSTLQGSRLTLAASHPPWRSGLFLQVHAGEGWAGKVKLGGQGECPPELAQNLPRFTGKAERGHGKRVTH